MAGQKSCLPFANDCFRLFRLSAYYCSTKSSLENWTCTLVTNYTSDLTLLCYVDCTVDSPDNYCCGVSKTEIRETDLATRNRRATIREGFRFQVRTSTVYDVRP
jgi:hypothetical protein